MTSRRDFLPSGALGLGVLLLTGCGEALSAENGAMSPGSLEPLADDATLPGIHIEQRVMMVDGDGRNSESRLYEDGLAACRTLGMATTELGADALANLGRSRHRLWIADGQWRGLSEHWALRAEGDDALACDFLVDYEVLDAAGEAYALPPAEEEAAIREVESRFGLHRLGTGAVAGHDCVRWEASDGRRGCVWSGGTGWGFDVQNLGGYAEESGSIGWPTALELDLEPEPSTGGIRVETVHLEIGPVPTAHAAPTEALLTTPELDRDA